MAYKDTKIRQNGGGNGRWFVFKIQYNRVGDQIEEQILDQKDFANQLRALNFKRKWDSELQYEREQAFENEQTYKSLGLIKEEK